MNGFRDCNFRQGTDMLNVQLSRLTLLREELSEPVLGGLCAFAEALLTGDILGAVSAYHGMTAALLNCGARRVTGNLFRDYILDLILVREQPFSRMAAKGEFDEATCMLMRSDLEVMRSLFDFDGDIAFEWTKERRNEIRNKNQSKPRDSASLIASAAWGGSSAPMRPVQPARESEQVLSFIGNEWASWNYYNGMRIEGEYAADEALEEMYCRMTESGDWGALLQDIWNLGATYGCGVFLETRNFSLLGGDIVPADDIMAAVLPPEGSPALNEGLSAELTANLIRFMRGEPCENVLITGGEGTGKTTLAAAVANELPELRVLYVDDINCIQAAVRCLAEQPLRFMVLFEGMSPGIIQAALSKAVLPDNILLVATQRAAQPTPLMPHLIEVPYMELNDYIELVESILEGRGVRLPQSEIRNACLDQKTETRGHLTPAAAKLTAARIAR